MPICRYAWLVLSRARPSQVFKTGDSNLVFCPSAYLNGVVRQVGKIGWSRIYINLTIHIYMVFDNERLDLTVGRTASCDPDEDAECHQRVAIAAWPHASNLRKTEPES